MADKTHDRSDTWPQFTEEIKNRDEKVMNEISELLDSIISDEYQQIKQKVKVFIERPDAFSENEMYEVLVNREVSALSDVEKGLIIDIVAYLLNKDFYNPNLEIFKRRIGFELKCNHRSSPFIQYGVDYESVEDEIDNWKQLYQLVAEAVFSGFSSDATFDEFAVFDKHLSENEKEEIKSIVKIRCHILGTEFLYQQYGAGIIFKDDSLFLLSETRDRAKGLKKLLKTGLFAFDVGDEVDDNGAPIDWLGDFDHAVEKIDNEYLRCILESKSKSSDTVRSITDAQDELLIVMMDEGIYIPDDGGAGHFVEYADITGVVENKDAIVIEARAAFGLLDNKMMLTDEHIELVISNPFRNKMIFKALRRTIADIVGLAKPDDGDISSIFEKNRNMADKCWIDDLYNHENVDSKRTINELVFDCHIYVSRNPEMDALCFACSDDESEWIVFFKDYFICKGNDIVTIARYDVIDHIEAAENTLVLSYPVSPIDYNNLLCEFVAAKYKGQVMDKTICDLAFKKEFISFKNDCFKTSIIC